MSNLKDFLLKNKIKATYRSGNGERFLRDLKHWNGTEWQDIPLEDFRDYFESEFDYLIRQNEHSNSEGYGYFVVEKGAVTKSEYDNSY